MLNDIFVDVLLANCFESMFHKGEISMSGTMSGDILEMLEKIDKKVSEIEKQMQCFIRWARLENERVEGTENCCTMLMELAEEKKFLDGFEDIQKRLSKVYDDRHPEMKGD